MLVYLIQYQICGGEYAGSTKTKFRTQQKFMNKEAVPKQALKQKSFQEYCYSDKYNRIAD